MGVPLRSESVRVVLKVGFKDRLDDYLHCHLHDPVLDHRYSQRSFTACHLRYVNPTDSLWLVVFRFSSRQSFQDTSLLLLLSPLCYQRFRHLFQALPCSLDKVVGVAQDVRPVYLVIEKIESVSFSCLAFRYSFL